MSTTIYLIRHGETAGNAEVRYIGWTDIPLDAKGVVQAQELCYKLQQYAIEEIYASPLQRAIATAAPIAEVLRKQIHIENGRRRSTAAHGKRSPRSKFVRNGQRSWITGQTTRIS